MELTVGEDAGAGRFQLTLDGVTVGHATDTHDGDAVVIDHVYTAPEHRGNGFAARLMEGLLDRLRADDRTVVPVCSYAVTYLRDHPDQHDLLA